MSPATFVLAISLFVAFTFATTFGVASLYARNGTGARWLAAGYGLGMFNPLLEILLPLQSDTRLIQVAVPLSLQLAAALGVVGLARHYRLSPPWRTLAAFAIGALLLNILILDMSRASALRNVLYQLPFFLIHLLGVVTILRFAHRQALDNALVSLFALSAIQFLLKPLLAVALGNGERAQDYIGSTYAAISQSVGSMLLIATGLMLLLIILRDMLAEMTARSETDQLSGLLNRRGFENRADRQLQALARGNGCGAVVVADLDHFKSVNDGFGHEAGDQVIETFGQTLLAHSGSSATVGRMGGEEFAILLPDCELDAAEAIAEQIRHDFSGLAIRALGPQRRVSASLGVAQWEPGETLSDLLRRADAALYGAKQAGRNRVCLAKPRLQAAG